MNEVKYLEAELARSRVQAQSEVAADATRKDELQRRLKDLEKENSAANQQIKDLRAELLKAQHDHDQMAARLDSALQMTQKDRVQQTVHQMDLDSYVA